MFPLRKCPLLTNQQARASLCLTLEPPISVHLLATFAGPQRPASPLNPADFAHLRPCRTSPPACGARRCRPWSSWRPDGKRSTEGTKEGTFWLSGRPKSLRKPSSLSHAQVSASRPVAGAPSKVVVADNRALRLVANAASQDWGCPAWRRRLRCHWLKHSGHLAACRTIGVPWPNPRASTQNLPAIRLNQLRGRTSE